MALTQVNIMQGQVRGLERGEPLARRGIREDQMIDQTRYKAWRSGPDAELHVIVYEGAELPFGILSLGRWLGSKEGEVANMKPHYRAMLEDTGFVVVRRRAVEFKTEG
jgi:hypothetical protein